MEIDPITGLPVEAIAWKDLAKQGQKIHITTEKKKYGKVVTVISGFDKGNDIKKIAKTLKNELACGGTYEDDYVELQGEHREKAKIVLIRNGFSEDAIEVN